MLRLWCVVVPRTGLFATKTFQGHSAIILPYLLNSLLVLPLTTVITLPCLVLESQSFRFWSLNGNEL